jgi:hypothetical protein
VTEVLALLDGRLHPGVDGTFGCPTDREACTDDLNADGNVDTE